MAYGLWVVGYRLARLWVRFLLGCGTMVAQWLWHNCGGMWQWLFVVVVVVVVVVCSNGFVWVVDGFIVLDLWWVVNGFVADFGGFVVVLSWINFR